MVNGTISALHRYPVKAMAGEALDAVDVGFHGLDGDRRYAFVQSSDDPTRFPWLTIREVPALTTYRAVCLGDPAESEPPTVTTPSGATLPVTDPALRDELAARHGKPVHLHRDYRGTQDAFPISIVSLQTVAALGSLAGTLLDPLRFRMSLVVDVPGGEFPEDAWIDRTVAIGDELRVRVNKRDSRCMVINFDPASAERDPRVLRAVAQQREQCLGVYGSVERPGRVRVGDALTVLESPVAA